MCQMPGPKRKLHVKQYCRRSCKICTPAVGGSVSLSSMVKPASTCSDVPGQTCSADICKMPGPKKVAFVKKNCRATCKICQANSAPAPVPVAPPSSTCADKTPGSCPADICRALGPKKKAFA